MIGLKCLFLGLGLLAIVSCLWPTDCGIGREKARTASCQANLKSLGLRFLIYANNHQGRFPERATVEKLFGAGRARLIEAAKGQSEDRDLTALLGCIQNTQMLYCPAASRSTRDTYSYGWNAKLSGLNINQIENPSKVPALYDRKPWHVDGRNVCFADAHVKWLREDDWKKAMAVEPTDRPHSSNHQPSEED
ncbi:MAG: DUF1559 domain-containing protein [Armatimonadetes bacterium]|nr:DUF1559 domain-containing protein [Armatimonadota bacterium]